MRRLSICIVVAVAIAVTSAWADWRNLGPTSQPIRGTPTDVEVLDAGYFALATDAGSPGGYEIFRDPSTSTAQVVRTITPQSSTDPFVNAFIDPSDDCLGGISSKGLRICPSGSLVQILPSSIASTAKVAQARHTLGGGGYVIAKYGSAAGSPYVGHFSSWSAAATGNIPSLDLGVQVSALRVGTTDYGLVGTNTGNIFLAVDDARPNPTDFNAQVGAIQDVQLFAISPTRLEALIAGSNGASNVSFQPDQSAVVTPNASLSGVNVTGLSFEYGTGDADAGTGFGMAVGTLSDGGTVIYSAVPDPDAPGQVWLPNTATALAPGTPKRVRCVGGQFCVLFTDAPPSGNVFLYYNLNRPSVFPPADTSLNEGDPTPMRLHATISDSDGDALFVKWTAADPALQVLYAADAGRDTVDISAPQNPAAFCGKGSVQIQLAISASDGRNVNVPAGNTITVFQTSKPGTPSVNVPAPSIPAGGAPMVVTATGAPSTPTTCATSGFTWTVNDGGITLSPNGASATLTPPRNYCNPNPGVGSFSVVGTDPGGMPSTPANFTVLLDPWGPPGSPLGGDRQVGQDAGATVTYSASDAHACSGAGGFPGVDNEWELPATSIADFQVAGTPVSGPRVTAPSVTVAAHACASGTFELAVTPYTRGDPNRIAGPKEKLTIDVQNVLVALADGGISLTGGYDAGVGTVDGIVSTGLNCAESRDVTARVSIRRASDPPNTALSAQQSALLGTPPSSAWSLPVPVSSCLGESFVVTGQIFEGLTPGPSTQLSFTTPPLAAGVAGVDVVQSPTAVCGDDGVVRAAGKLKARFGAGQCTAAQLTWDQLGGAPVTGAPLSGTDVSFEAPGTFEQLTAQPLQFRVTSDVGNGSPSSLDVSVPVSLARFVGVRHRTDAPISSASEILGVEVKLENPSACGVTGAVYREQLDGLRYVPGSARLDGAPVEVLEQGNDLFFTGLELPAHGTRTLTYSARPRLLGSPQPRGQAFLNDQALSDAQGLGALPQQGCGCSGGGAGLSALALAAAGLMLRRRARR